MFSTMRCTQAAERFAGPLVGVRSVSVGIELLVFAVMSSRHEDILKLCHAAVGCQAVNRGSGDECSVVTAAAGWRRRLRR
jgi:hypothetical protein